MDNVPKGFQAGKDYVSVVSSDNYGNGIFAGEIMGEELKRKRQDRCYFSTMLISLSITSVKMHSKKTIKEKYPNIKIVAHGGIITPNDAEKKVASGMLTKKP
ncbi:hypothetical protein GCM10020331_008710 [Ectobacillus funiculus]